MQCLALLIETSARLFCKNSLFTLSSVFTFYGFLILFLLRRQLDIGFECNWDSSVHEILRIIRTNSSRLLRSLIVQPGAPNAASKASTTAAQEAAPGRKLERRTQLIVALTRARLQLDIAHYLADTGIVRSLDLLDSMDKSLAKSLRHLRISYGLHFPELCRNGGLPGLDDFVFVSIVTNIPSRDQLVKSKDQLIEWLNGDARMAETIIELAKTSTGQDLSSDDLRTLQHYGQFLLNLLKVFLCFLVTCSFVTCSFLYSSREHSVLKC